MIKDRVGWIYPTGKIVELEVFKHLEHFFEDSEAREVLGFESLAKFEEWAEEKWKDDQSKFLDQVSEEDHTPWHAFSGYPDEQIRWHVESCGFRRWGTYTDKYNEFILSVECRNSSDMPSFDVMNELMDLVGTDLCHCVFWGYRASRTVKKFRREDNEIRLVRG